MESSVNVLRPHDTLAVHIKTVVHRWMKNGRVSGNVAQGFCVQRVDLVYRRKVGFAGPQ